MVFDKINSFIFRDNYLSQTGIDSIKDLYIYLVNKKFSDEALNQVLEHFNHQVRKSTIRGEEPKVSFIGIDERTNEIIYCFNIDKDEKKRAVAKCFLRPRCIYIRYSKNLQ